MTRHLTNLELIAPALAATCNPAMPATHVEAVREIETRAADHPEHAASKAIRDFLDARPENFAEAIRDLTVAHMAADAAEPWVQAGVLAALGKPLARALAASIAFISGSGIYDFVYFPTPSPERFAELQATLRVPTFPPEYIEAARKLVAETVKPAHLWTEADGMDLNAEEEPDYSAIASDYWKRLDKATALAEA